MNFSTIEGDASHWVGKSNNLGSFSLEDILEIDLLLRWNMNEILWRVTFLTEVFIREALLIIRNNRFKYKP